jgi:hypothetical protein
MRMGPLHGAAGARGMGKGLPIAYSDASGLEGSSFARKRRRAGAQGSRAPGRRLPAFVETTGLELGWTETSSKKGGPLPRQRASSRAGSAMSTPMPRIVPLPMGMRIARPARGRKEGRGGKPGANRHRPCTQCEEC